MTLDALSVQIQSILYNNNMDHIDRLIKSVYRSYLNSVADGSVSKIVYSVGDCSPEPLVKDKESWEKSYTQDGFEVKYTFFNANLGHGGGHNRLSKHAETDLIGILNPDVIVSPKYIQILASELHDESVGIAEATQVPLEHPKEYDLKTRETSFASGCCFFIRRSLYEEINGFDHETFFMYCDDVDLSWRVRLKNKRLIFCPDACVYHDHRLSDDGTLSVGRAEFYYSALGGILLAHKWGREDIAQQYLSHLEKNPDYKEVLEEYLSIKEKGDLPSPVPGADKVSIFSPTGYANYRWTN